MKKLLTCILTLVFMLLSASYAMAENVINLGYDVSGTIREDNGLFLLGEMNTDPAFSLGYEYIFSEDTFGLGFGFEYPFERTLTDYQDAKFNFVPIYFVINAYPSQDDVKPFFTVRLGYNFQTGNDAYKNGWSLGGGLYGALGGGIYFSKQFRGSLIYSVNMGSVSRYGNTHNLTYGKFGITLGYTF